MATYRALQDGSIGNGKLLKRIRKGELFELPKDLKPGKWMEKVSDKSAPAAPDKSEAEVEKQIETKAGNPDDAKAAQK